MEDPGLILGQEDLLEKKLATYSNILAWRIPWRAWQAIYSPWGHKESDTIEQLTHTWLSFSHSVVSDSATTWTAACQASLPFIISSSLLKLKSIEWAMPSNHPLSVVPFSSCLQSFTASGSFPVSQFFTSGGQSIRVSTSFQ